MTVPTLPLLSLSAPEALVVDKLQKQITWNDWRLRLRDAYYKGEQGMIDLGISIPPNLRNLRIAIGWPRIGVEAKNDRLAVDLVRYAGADDYDDELSQIFDDNGLGVELQIATLDALVFGRDFLLAGISPDQESPLVTAESPLNMAVTYDPRRRMVTEAFQRFTFDGRAFGMLMLPDETVTLTADSLTGGWTVEDRDRHNLGFVAAERVANRTRTNDRTGTSDITAEIMNLTDAGCRALLRADIGGEFFNAPQRYIIGASEEAFTNPDGTPRSAWETYIGRLLALEADDEGNLPTVGQFPTGDPTANTKLIDAYAKILGSITGLPSEWYGYASDGNPASADAIRSNESRLDRKVDKLKPEFGAPIGRIMQKAVAVKHGVPVRAVPPVETDWLDLSTRTPVSDSDAISKQAAAEAVTAWSSVVLRKLGYTSREIQQLQRDKRTADAQAALALARQQAAQASQPATDTPGTPPADPAKAA